MIYRHVFFFFRLPVFIVKGFIPGVLINGGIIVLKRTRRKLTPILDKCYSLPSLLLHQGCQVLLGKSPSILLSWTPTTAEPLILWIKFILVHGWLSPIPLNSYFKLSPFSLNALLFYFLPCSKHMNLFPIVKKKSANPNTGFSTHKPLHICLSTWGPHLFPLVSSNSLLKDGTPLSSAPQGFTTALRLHQISPIFK